MTIASMIEALETDRLILRPFATADVDEIYRLVYADARVREAWSGYAGTLSEFRKRFATDDVWHAEDGFGFLAMVRKEDNALLGLIGFQRHEPGEDTSHMVFEDRADEIGTDPAMVEVELTYALGHMYWGHGYATESGRALIDYGFEKLGIGRIVNAVIVHPRHRSLALVKRLGFRVVKNLNESYVTHGAFAGSPGVIGILER